MWEKYSVAFCKVVSVLVWESLENTKVPFGITLVIVWSIPWQYHIAWYAPKLYILCQKIRIGIKSTPDLWSIQSVLLKHYKRKQQDWLILLVLFYQLHFTSFLPRQWLLSHIIIIETMISGQRGINSVAMIIINHQGETDQARDRTSNLQCWSLVWYSVLTKTTSRVCFYQPFSRTFSVFLSRFVYIPGLKKHLTVK